MPTEKFVTAPNTIWPSSSPSAWVLAAACTVLVACQHTPLPEPTPLVVSAPVQDSVAATPLPLPIEVAPLPDATRVETTEASLASLLHYADRLRNMTAAERKQELNALGNQVPRSGTGPTPGSANDPKIQMQLAIALLQTREPVETARALGLLQRVTTSPEPQARPFVALAQLLIDNLITTTRRLEDNLERSNQQLRESQRKIDALTERLDAMRAIGRSMNAPPPVFPRPFRQ